jgi:hypothetical protein
MIILEVYEEVKIPNICFGLIFYFLSLYRSLCSAVLCYLISYRCGARAYISVKKKTWEETRYTMKIPRTQGNITPNKRK